MKNIFIILIFISGVGQLSAQKQRAGILATQEQSIGIATGIDYAIAPLILSYKRSLNPFSTSLPAMAGIEVSIPLYSFDANDIRIRLLTEIVLLKKNNFEFRGGINPLLVNLKMETETMTSLGVDFHIFTGFTGEKWSFGADFIYNKIFSTNIKHTDKYRDNVFAGAVDGWYKNTASNIRMGLMINRRINRIDAYLRTGWSTTGKVNSYLFVPPIYMQLGLDYRF